MLSNLPLIFLTWAPNILFCLGLVPQLVLNFQHKSCTGISDWFLLACMNGYWAFVVYSFALGLPLAYQLLVPFSAFLFFIILSQRFWYNGFFPEPVRTVFSLNVLLLVGATIAYYFQPLIVGHIAGWIIVVMFTCYQVPQIFKMRTAQTTVGFSVGLVCLFACGDIIELAAAFILGFPIQTIISDIRGLLIAAILLWQFYRYRAG